MGVPGLYRTLFKRYKNKNIYRWVSLDENVDYFYMDFNPIIYRCLATLQISGKLNGKLTKAQIESRLIHEIIDSTAFIINDLVQAKKMTYIAIDGPAPKCKIITQRFRRYKAILERQIKTEIKKKYSDAAPELNWDRSNITPGTIFMSKLDQALHNAVSKGVFKGKVILNDSSIPSEGEHKITQHMMQLQHEPEEKFAVFSNDGDMAILGLQFPKKQIVTMIDTSFLPNNQKKVEKEYVYFDNQVFQDALIEDIFYERKEQRNERNEKKVKDPTSTEDNLTGVIEGPPVKKRKVSEMKIRKGMDGFDKERVYIDFMCLTFFGGNDFMKPFLFAKMRNSGTYSMLMWVYRNVRKKRPQEYLVEEDKRSLNKDFLQDLLLEFAKQENRKMRDMQQYIVKCCNETDPQGWGPFPTWEEEWGAYQHTRYTDASHPMHTTVRDVLLSFDYLQSDQKRKWKGQYYKHHFNLDPADSRTYNQERSKICRAYVKCMIFTLQYYLTGKPPSWNWNYPYHAAPWPSDIHITLKHMKDLNGLGIFHYGTPYSPLEQLLLTIPIQSKTFPKEFNELKPLLPKLTSIDLDRVNGEKYIYAEPFIPPLNEKLLLEKAREIPLKGSAAKRNEMKPIKI